MKASADISYSSSFISFYEVVLGKFSAFLLGVFSALLMPLTIFSSTAHILMPRCIPLSLFLFCDDEFELFFEGLSISPDIIICFAPFL